MRSEYILPDSLAGLQFGFTSKKFAGVLMRQDSVIIILFLYSFSRNNDHLKQLFKTIKEQNYNIEIMVSLPRIEAVASREGFKKKINYNYAGIDKINYQSMTTIKEIDI